MSDNLTVRVDFVGDSKPLQQNIKQLASVMGSLRKKQENLTKASTKQVQATKKATAASKQLTSALNLQGNAHSKTSKKGMFQVKNNRLLSNSFATLRSKMLLVSFAASVFTGSIGKLALLSGEQEKAEKRLSQAIGGTSQSLLDQASALQAVTVFGDEQIIGVQASLAQYVREEDKLKQLTAATLDFATAKGMDLKSASELVGKSLGSSTNALQRYGINVVGAVGSQERFNMAMEGLTKDGIAGQASAEAETFAGQMAQTKNVLGDVGELLGKEFIPFISLVTTKVGDWAKRMNEGGVTLKRFKMSMKALFAPMKISWALVKKLWGWFGELFKVTENARTSIKNALVPAFTILGNVFSQIITIGGNMAKMLGRILVGDFDGAKKAAHDAAVAISSFTFNIEEGSVQAKNLSDQVGWLDDTTGGLITDIITLNDATEENTKVNVENKNSLDDLNRAKLNQASLDAQITSAESKLAEKQLLLSVSTLSQENETKAYIKTLKDFNKATEQNIQITEAKSIADLEAFVEKNFQNEEEKERLLALLETQHSLNQVNAIGAISDKKFREERQKSIFALSKSLGTLMGDSRMAALVGLRIQQAEAIANAHAAAGAWNEDQRPVLAALAYAKGIAHAAAIEKQQGKVRSAETGADFITQGQQMLMVGDNPSGRERVQVTPLGNNASGVTGNSPSSVNININGNILGTEDFVRDTLLPQLEDSLERNLA